jgi:DNA-binding response OmpR family regulator
MIFYVEDDLMVADLWAFEMREEGYNVIIMRTPDELLDKLVSIPTDLTAIIVDMMLPLGDSIDASESEAGLRTGFVLIKKIRDIFKKQGRTCVPILAITIRSDYKDELEGMGVPIVSKRRDSPGKVLDILRKMNVAPDRSKKIET